MNQRDRGQGRKALFAVCGPVWRVLWAGGCLPLRHCRGPLCPATGGSVAVSCSVFKVLISTGRRLTPPVPMGYTHERPPRCGGGWACTSGGGCRRPCGLSSGALSREHVNRKHTAPVRLIVCADLLLGEVREFLTIAACLKCPRVVPVVVPNDHVYHFSPFRIVILFSLRFLPP